MITSSNVACPRDDRAMHIFIWRTNVKERSLTILKQKGDLDIFCIGPIPVSPITAKSDPLDVSTFARKSPERYWTG